MVRSRAPRFRPAGWLWDLRSCLQLLLNQEPWILERKQLEISLPWLPCFQYIIFLWTDRRTWGFFRIDILYFRNGMDIFFKSIFFYFWGIISDILWGTFGEIFYGIFDRFLKINFGFLFGFFWDFLRDFLKIFLKIFEN